MARNSIILWAVFLVFISVNTSHGYGEVVTFARNYLKTFGYLSADYYASDTYDEALESALLKYQRFYGLNATGRIEPDTLRSMMRPRCGVPDFPSIYNSSRDVTPQYTLFERTWPPSKRLLAYGFNTPFIVPIDVLRPVFSSAFSKWSQVTKFTFREEPIDYSPDLRIGFFSRDHGDGVPFDGPGGILAHSFGPMVGLSHYDTEEHWSTNPGPDQFDLESIVLHEIGHLLGLGHTSVESAVMFATMADGKTKRDLQPDDIDGVHALYPLG